MSISLNDLTRRQFGKLVAGALSAPIINRNITRSPVTDKTEVAVKEIITKPTKVINRKPGTLFIDDIGFEVYNEVFSRNTYLEQINVYPIPDTILSCSEDLKLACYVRGHLLDINMLEHKSCNFIYSPSRSIITFKFDGYITGISTGIEFPDIMYQRLEIDGLRAEEI